MESRKNKIKYIASFVIFCVTLISFAIFIEMSERLTLNMPMKTILTTIMLCISFVSISSFAKIGYKISMYRCKHCKEYFVPTFAQHFFGVKIKLIRHLKYLRCPKCNKKSWCEHKFK